MLVERRPDPAAPVGIVREAAWRVLGKYLDQGLLVGVDRLLELAKPSEDPAFRNAAVGALARVEDPALVAKLQSAVLEGGFKGTEALNIVNRQMARTATTEQTFRWLQENGDTLGDRLVDPQAIVGRFATRTAQGSRLLDGFLSPATDATGKVNGHVFMGRDITEAEARLEAAANENNRLATEQRQVVDALRHALQRLSDGDLSTRIETAFAGEYDVKVQITRTGSGST